MSLVPLNNMNKMRFRTEAVHSCIRDENGRDVLCIPFASIETMQVRRRPDDRKKKGANDV